LSGSVAAVNTLVRDAVFDMFEEELIGVQVYPVGQFGTIRVQVNPDGQLTCACVFDGTMNATANDKVTIGIAR
jgi:hypothetical protein